MSRMRKWIVVFVSTAVMAGLVVSAGAEEKKLSFSLHTETVAIDNLAFYLNTIKFPYTGFYYPDRGEPLRTSFYEDSKGTLWAFSADRVKVNDSYVVRTYVNALDGSGKERSIQLPSEFTRWGGFYEAPDGFVYLAVGMFNLDENDSTKVYTILKYDKEWNLKGRADVTGGQTITRIPYYLSTCDFAYDNGMLIIYTSRERYTDEEGINHQSNITLKINTESMRVLEASNEFPNNHVAHTFGQRVRFDGSKAVYVDHGDAYPRSVVLQVDPSPKQKTASGQYLAQVNMLDIPGTIGDNYTGVCLGGMEVGKNGYLVVGNSVPQNYPVEGVTGSQESLKRNVFLSSVSKGGKTANFRWITKYNPNGSEYASVPYLLKLSDDRFALFHEKGRADSNNQPTHSATFCMILDSSGKTLADEQINAQLPVFNSSSMTQLKDGRIVWAVTTEKGSADVYTLSIG